jgi:hypothetical protein
VYYAYTFGETGGDVYSGGEGVFRSSIFIDVFGWRKGTQGVMTCYNCWFDTESMEPRPGVLTPAGEGNSFGTAAPPCEVRHLGLVTLELIQGCGVLAGRPIPVEFCDDPFPGWANRTLIDTPGYFCMSGVTLANCVITNGVTGNEGGAVNLNGGGVQVMFTHCAWYRCGTNGRGGGVFINTVLRAEWLRCCGSECTCQSRVPNLDGGGFLMLEMAGQPVGITTLVIDHVNVHYCQAWREAGGICFRYTQAALTWVNFTRCEGGQADVGGTAGGSSAFFFQSVPTGTNRVHHVHITNSGRPVNPNFVRLGAIKQWLDNWNSIAESYMSDSIFVDQTTDYCCYAEDAGVVIRNSRFWNCPMTFGHATGTGHVRISGCLFSGNTLPAPVPGRIIYEGDGNMNSADIVDGNFPGECFQQADALGELAVGFVVCTVNRNCRGIPPGGTPPPAPTQTPLAGRCDVMFTGVQSRAPSWWEPGTTKVCFRNCIYTNIWRLDGDGGAMYLEGAQINFTVDGCSFVQCIAGGCGGGESFTNALIGCVWGTCFGQCKHTTASKGGGALLFELSLNDQPSLTSDVSVCSMFGCVTARDGGGIHHRGCNPAHSWNNFTVCMAANVYNAGASAFTSQGQIISEGSVHHEVIRDCRKLNSASGTYRQFINGQAQGDEFTSVLLEIIWADHSHDLCVDLQDGWLRLATCRFVHCTFQPDTEPEVTLFQVTDRRRIIFTGCLFNAESAMPAPIEGKLILDSGDNIVDPVGVDDVLTCFRQQADANAFCTIPAFCLGQGATARPRTPYATNNNVRTPAPPRTAAQSRDPNLPDPTAPPARTAWALATTIAPPTLSAPSSKATGVIVGVVVGVVVVAAVAAALLWWFLCKNASGDAASLEETTPKVATPAASYQAPAPTAPAASTAHQDEDF